jgi:hypothetical protein
MMPFRQDFFSPDKPFCGGNHLTCKQLMKNVHIFSFVLLISCDCVAQKQDSVPVKPLVEKGGQGDILLGKETKKAQLSAAPQILNAADPSQKKNIRPKKKNDKKT